MHSTDLLVVGGGVLGAFHAYHALRRGLRVTLLEKNAQPQGATVRNFGQVVPSGMPPGEWFEYGRESTVLYKEIQAQTDLTVRNAGSVYVASDADELTLCQELCDHHRAETDYPCEMLSAAAVLERLPGLRPEYAVGGLLFPTEVTVEARTMVGRLLAWMVETMNLDYRPQTLVVQIDADGDGVTATDARGRVVRAGHAVVCSGAEFKALFPDVFAASDIEVAKLQMLETVPQPHGYRLPGSVLTGLTIRRYEAFRSLPSYGDLDDGHLDPALATWGVHLLFKQGADGAVIVGDSHEYALAADADDLGFDLRDDVNALILREARAILDLPDWTLRRSWFGVYPQRPGGGVFQRTVGDRVHVVTAIGGKGMTASAGFSRHHIDQIYA